MPTLGKALLVLGLVFDVLGAVFIALGIFTNTAARMCDVAETRVGFNDSVLKPQAEERAQVITGVLYLILGFLLQIVAAVPVWSQTLSLSELLTGTAFFLLLAGFSPRILRTLSRRFHLAARREMIRRLLVGQRMDEESSRYNSLEVYAQLPPR